jgi:hypothetical protein
MITCPVGVFLMEPGARTAILSYGGSGIGMGNHDQVVHRGVAGQLVVVSVAITLSAICAMWVNLSLRSAISRMKEAVVSR